MDALTRDPRFLAARKTDQSGQRGWNFAPPMPPAQVPSNVPYIIRGAAGLLVFVSALWGLAIWLGA